MTEDKTLHCSAPQLVCLWKIEVMRVLPHGCPGNEKKAPGQQPAEWVTIFHDGSDAGCEGRVKVKGDSTFFGLSNWKVKVAIN